ncbi:MAG: hypothetical protein M5R36_14435 [Deltaproteobacteria bacterium]|nr:hypothetical protein [Deltaproteobacteria bacterium]
MKDQGFVSGVATFTALAVLFTAHFVWNRRDTLRAMLREPLAHRSREEQNEIFQVALLTYPILFSVLYAASGFRVVPADDPTPGLYVNYRYFVPVFPFLFLLFGAGVQDIWERARPDRMFRAVAMALALLGAFGLARYYLRLDDRRPAAYFTAWQYRGDDVSHLMNRLAAQLPRDNDPYAEKGRPHPPPPPLGPRFLLRVHGPRRRPRFRRRPHSRARHHARRPPRALPRPRSRPR